MSKCHGCGEKDCHKYPKCSKKCLCDVEIPSFKCVRTDEDFSCIGIVKGDTLSKAIANISAKLCNFIGGQQGPAGVGISSTTYNDETGVLTFNYTNGFSFSTGDIRGEQGPEGEQGPIGETGPPGPETLLIENTLIVSKNGVDLTGVRNDWTKPFLTITAASNAASIGDVIIIFPGTYNEGNNDWIKSGVNYFFYKGSNVQNSTNCITDQGNIKDVRIFGEGNFTSTGGSGIMVTNPASTSIIRCNDVTGFNNGVEIHGFCDVQGRQVTNSFQYCGTFRDKANGRVYFDKWNAVTSSGAPAIYIFNHSPDAETLLHIQVGRVTSNASAGIFEMNNTGIFSKLKVSINDFQGTVSTGYFLRVSSCLGSLEMEATGKTTGLGFSFSDSGKVLIKHSNIFSVEKSFATSGSIDVTVKDSYIDRLEGEEGDGSTLNHTSGQLILNDSTVKFSAEPGTPYAVFNIVNAAAKLYLRNARIVSEGDITTSIGGVPANIYAELLFQTFAFDVGLTNVITGGLVITDTDII